jgi:hypothetical protein
MSKNTVSHTTSKGMLHTISSGGICSGIKPYQHDSTTLVIPPYHPDSTTHKVRTNQNLKKYEHPMMFDIEL